MKQEKSKKIILVLIGIIALSIGILVIHRITNSDIEIPKETIAQNNISNEIYDKKNIEEIKYNISIYEKEWISNSKGYTLDNKNAKDYLDNVYNELLKINKDNYQEYFSMKLEYANFVATNVLEIGNLLTDLYEDILSLEKDVNTGTNTMKVFIDSFNNQYVEYLQNNSEVLFADSYTSSRASKYDSLQEEIQKGLESWEDTKYMKLAITTLGEVLEMVGEDFERAGVNDLDYVMN